MLTLRDGVWLNSDVLDFFFKKLIENNRQISFISSTDRNNPGLHFDPKSEMILNCAFLQNAHFGLCQILPGMKRVEFFDGKLDFVANRQLYMRELL